MERYVGGGGIGSDVRARDQRKPRPQCPHGSMDTLDREESGLKLVHGLACSGRTPCRSGRRALRESADVARNLYRIAYSCRAPLHQPYPVTRRLQSSTAIQPSTLYSSTALYSIQPLQHPSEGGPVHPQLNGVRSCDHWRAPHRRYAHQRATRARVGVAEKRHSAVD